MAKRKIETHLDYQGKKIFFPDTFFKGFTRLLPALRAFLYEKRKRLSAFANSTNIYHKTNNQERCRDDSPISFLKNYFRIFFLARRFFNYCNRIFNTITQARILQPPHVFKMTNCNQFIFFELKLALQGWTNAMPPIKF